MNRPESRFWHNKRVLLTGHTGFKGGWLAIWLHGLGARVTGISLPPETEPNLFGVAGIEGLCEQSHVCDIRDAKKLARLMRDVDPQIVMHLAAQPLVRASYREPVETFEINTMGTVHVLDALRGLSSVKVAVMITTDKVYRNLERPWPYRENDALGGYDPYSASKAACEMAVISYRDAFLRQQGVAVASARAGNVLGGGDWSEDRLIPDAVRAWQSGETLHIRRPMAIRPWQHVLEPLAGYLKLVEALWKRPEHAGAYNFGPDTSDAASVRAVAELAREIYGGGSLSYGDGSQGPHEANWLALEIAKARAILGHIPCWSLKEAVSRTMHWYRAQYEGKDALGLCRADIAAYQQATRNGAIK